MVKITGAAEVSRRLRSMGPEVDRQIGAVLFAGGQVLEVDWARSITEGSVSGKGHVPSLPGEPPNADTHVLDRSIQTVQVSPFRAEVSEDAPYAVALEFGTSKMAERPAARPATARTRKQIVALIEAGARKIVAGGKVA